jgi:hypothetical protein
MSVICGISHAGDGLSYPDIGTRFRRYHPWATKDGVYQIRFEDLVSDEKEDHLRRIMAFFLAHQEAEWTEDTLFKHALQNIAPKKSHTFRRGERSGWRTAFAPEHKQALKKYAGDLLIELGYEKDQNW